MSAVNNEVESGKVFDLDALLEPLGGFGKFQIINLLHISFIIILAGITEISYVFTASELKHRCLIPECEAANSTFDQPWLSSAIPRTTEGEYSECQRYKIIAGGNSHDSCSNVSFTTDSIECDKFIYETDEWTIAREDWDIHCNNDRWKLTLIGSLNNAGIVTGSLFVGFLCDRYGRKAVIVSMSIIVALLGTIKSFSVNYAMFASFEFIETAMEGGLFTLPFVLALEIVEPSKRVVAGAFVTCAYSLGEIIIGCVQWATLDWRKTLQIVRIPFLIILLFYWTLPESVRWLITKGRKNEGLEVLEKIAKTNGTILSKEAVNYVLNQNEDAKKIEPNNKSELRAMLKSKPMLLRFTATLFVWIANTFIFFGMNLNSVSINDNKFLNAVLTSGIEIPAYLSIIYLMSRLGRRNTQCGSLFLCSIACILFAFAPDWYWAHLLLYLLGKFGIAISFITVEVYTTELFPTSVRASTISIGHMIGRIAAILAPQTPLLEVYYKQLPLLIFSILAAVGGTLASTLPETVNIKLPNTVEEAEHLDELFKKNKRDRSFPSLSCLKCSSS